jgi:hypothetical protein
MGSDIMGDHDMCEAEKIATILMVLLFAGSLIWYNMGDNDEPM